MFKLFKLVFAPSLSEEITKNITSLDREITSHELNRITLETHIDSLYEKRNYLIRRLSELAPLENPDGEDFPLSAGIVSPKLPRTSGYSSPPSDWNLEPKT